MWLTKGIKFHVLSASTNIICWYFVESAFIICWYVNSNVLGKIIIAANGQMKFKTYAMCMTFLTLVYVHNNHPTKACVLLQSLRNDV